VRWGDVAAALLRVFTIKIHRRVTTYGSYAAPALKIRNKVGMSF
jgi:hypothetical protein